MNKRRLLLITLKMLTRESPWMLPGIFILTLLAGLTTGFSFLLLIPLLDLLSVTGESDALTGFAGYFNDLYSRLGLSPGLESILLAFFLLLSFTALVNYLKQLLDTRYQQSLIFSLRERLFRKIILSDWENLSRRGNNTHLQVITREIPEMANYYYYFMQLLTGVLTALVFISYALLLSVKFTLVVVLSGALIFLVLAGVLRKAVIIGEESATAYTGLLKSISDFWLTAKIAKVHRSEKFYSDKFNSVNRRLRQLEIRMVKNHALPQFVYRISGIAVLCIAVFAGYSLGNIPLASFVVLVMLFARIFPIFISASKDIHMIAANIPSVKRVLELDSALGERDFPVREEIVKLEMKKGIRLENIGFSYEGGVDVLKEINHNISANSITGILGASGRGKTTLVDIISGLMQPGSGRVLIDDLPLEGRLLASWRAGIGYLPQSPFFIDGSLRENLVWDSRHKPGDEEILKTIELVKASHLIKRYSTGLDTVIENYMHSFSGGEYQRLALARVLLRKPGVLLLDEATSQIDDESEKSIMELLQELKKEVTIIFITHREYLMPWFDGVVRL